MEALARGGWTDTEILNALRAVNGTKEMHFRADILVNGAKDREVSFAPGGSVTMDTDGDILRTARLELYEELDWLTEEVKPYMLLRMEDAETSSSVSIATCAERDALWYTCAQWDALGLTCVEYDTGIIGGTASTPQYAEFPLGVFIPSSPTRSSSDGVNTWSVECYDRTIILKEDGYDAPEYIEAGTLYLDAVQAILANAGVATIMIADYVDTAIPADREFEIGTSKLEAINTLLSEINFNPIYCDVDGRFVLEAYKEPTISSIDFTYSADEKSIIELNTTSETDFYAMPNVWIAVCSNPDLGEDYRSVYINDNPLSEFSTTQRGRRIISEIFQPEQIASQADLDAYIRRVAYERMTDAGERVTFITAINPTHGRADDIGLQHPDVSGAFREKRWAIPFEGGGMEHAGRRTVLM